jgi:diguanylate cyclase (GGDEF)-like protein
MKLTRGTKMILTANFAIILGETAVMYMLPQLKLGNYALAIALDVLVLVVITTVFMRLVLGRAEFDLEAANRDLSLKVAELKARAQDTALLEEMGELMLTTRSPEETYDIVARYIGRLFPDTRGALYVLRHSRNALEEAGSWGDKHGSEPWFAPEDCWAFRRGKRHLVSDADANLTCGHMKVSGADRCCCVPMVANGDALGMLYIEATAPAGARVVPQAPGVVAELKLELLVLLVERVGLALANNHLQRKLESQSIHDPLTGLFNRRYLEESFQKELHRARRKQEHVGIIMLDLDHFKQVNDEYGHDAGDAVLKAVAVQLHKTIREEDIACRLGGEEFLLVLPGMPIEHLQRRADQLLCSLAEMRLSHAGRMLRPVTASLGLACFPGNGGDQAALLRAADQALYASKHAGRNRISVAAPVVDTSAEAVAAEAAIC